MAVRGKVTLADRRGLIIEYIEGRDLRRVLAKVGPVPTRCAADILARVADALHAAYHAPCPDGSGPLRLIHRDIKPANIMLSPRGRVVLLDFGVARTDATEREAQTSTGYLVGTGSYTAPEALAHEPPTDKADVWGLALTMYEAMTGDQLFEKLDMKTLVRLVRDGDPRAEVMARLSVLPLPADLLGLLLDMTELDPEDRPTAAEVGGRRWRRGWRHGSGRPCAPAPPSWTA